MEQEATQSNRRAYTRAVFAYVEGMLSRLKQTALEQHDKYAPTFSPAELALLREETYGVNRKGDAVARHRFLPLAENVLFTLRAFHRVFGLEYHVPKQPWSEFQRAVEIRNRVTHPHHVGDSRVDDKDLWVVKVAEEWFYGVLDSSFREISRRYPQ